MFTSYPPAEPKSGLYRVKILSVVQDETTYLIRYDIAVGPSTGWATYMYQHTGEWLLVWRLNKSKATIPVKCAIDAINHSTAYQIQTLDEAPGHHLCLQLYRNKNCQYIDVKKSFSANTFQIHPEDIRIENAGGWKQGNSNWCRAVLLASLSGLPVLHADSHESHSPMVEWCAQHNIILLPQHFVAGDYTMVGSRTIVDRKENIQELYKNFASSDNRISYENAAIFAQATEKQLIYVVGTTPTDKVKQISDLKNWCTTVKGTNFKGSTLEIQLLRHIMHFPNVSFYFVHSQDVCSTTWKLISNQLPSHI